MSIHAQELIEHSAHMIMSVDLKGEFVFVNPTLCETLEYEQNALMELNVYDLIHPEFRTEYNRVVERVTQGERVNRFETSLVTPDGRPVAVEGSCACSFTNGQPRAIMSVLHDVTERKRAEEVLARQAAELLKARETMEERDREVAESLEQARKYQEAQERAQELSEINEELKQENVRRREAEEQITASLREKEVLLKEIHHRVKNNLQIISSLLNLQSGYTEDPETLEMYRESQSRIHSMALIHEKLYQSGDLARVDFPEYVRNLVGYLFRSYSAGAGQVAMDVDVAPVFLSLDVSIPCGLIISELVTNALKYAFPQGKGGKLFVGLHSESGDRYSLIVRDDGIGFPNEVDFQNTDSLGLQLVMTLTEQLDGDISLQKGDGTEFRISFQAS